MQSVTLWQITNKVREIKAERLTRDFRHFTTSKKHPESLSWIPVFHLSRFSPSYKISKKQQKALNYNKIYSAYLILMHLTCDVQKSFVVYIFLLFPEWGATVFQGLHQILHHRDIKTQWQWDIQPYHHDLQPGIKNLNQMDLVLSPFELNFFPYLSSPIFILHPNSC